MTALDIGAARRRTVWLEALDELHAEAHRTGNGDGIAVLHVLEERAHETFAEYREYVLGPADAEVSQQF